MLAVGIRGRDCAYMNFPLSLMSVTEDVDPEIDREPYVEANARRLFTFMDILCDSD